jgi:hypothetical protein
MAIAGSSIEAFNLVLVGDQLINQGSSRMAPHMVEKDPAKALAKLKQYKAVRLWKYGDNLAELKRLLASGSQAAQEGQGEAIRA